MNLIKHIKSNQFALWVAILSVIVQSFHSYTAFYNTSSLQGTIWGIIQAIGFAAVVDLAILFYTVRGRRDIALMAAFAMIVINSYYYYQHWHFSFEFWFGVFLSFIIPASVYFYSEEIDDEDIDTDALLKAQKSIIDIERTKNINLEKQVRELDEHLAKRLIDLEQADNAALKWKTNYEMLGKSHKSLVESYNKINMNAAIKSDNQVGNYSKAIEEVQDKSLLNVTDDIYRPAPMHDLTSELPKKMTGIISTDKPVTE